MLKISLDPAASSAVIKAACNYARTPISIKFKGRCLCINGMSPEDASKALAAAAFPAREKQLLQKLSRKVLPKAGKMRRRQLTALAQTLAEEDIPLNPLYQGSQRKEMLAAEFLTLLRGGGCDLDGFCRFRLTDYEKYLKNLLLQAEEALTAHEEEEAYYRLLSSCLSKGKGQITIFFYEGEICQIWEKGEEGLRQLEGGHIHGVEWLLLANLIKLDPCSITLKNSVYAAPILLDMLERVFGDKLIMDA